MCIGAAPLLGMALSIAGAMVEYSAAVDAADQQNAYYMENAREAQRAARETYVHQQLRIAQEKEASGQEAFEAKIKALEKRGSAFASAGEAGVAGLSVDALIGNVFAQEGRQLMAIDTQFKMNRDAQYAEMRETEGRTQARINSVQRASYPSPGAFLVKGLLGGRGGFKGSGLAIA